MTVSEVDAKRQMASTSLCSKIMGMCGVNIELNKIRYENMKFKIMKDLCADVILGLDFQPQHESVTLMFGDMKEPLIISGLTILKTEPPSPFQNITKDCKPVASKSRNYSDDDKKFIASEVQRLYKEGIIEPLTSPWISQVVVTKTERQKKRLAIDYSETINRFTQLDAYPFPKVDEIINKIAKYRYFSTIDLKSAYHQIPLREEDRLYTAFEADGGLHQFTRIPFGVTNGIACFQRTMDNFLLEEELDNTFAFMDNLTICGMTEKEHDINLEKFSEAAKPRNLNKCTFICNVLN